MEKDMKVIYINNQNEYFHCRPDKTRQPVSKEWIDQCLKEKSVTFHFVRESHVDLIVTNYVDLFSSDLVKPNTLELFSEFGFISCVEYNRLIEKTIKEGA